MKYRLDDICCITSAKRIFESEYVNQGIPFIRGLEITNGSLLKDGTKFECYISRERYEQIVSKYGKPSTGDILITAVGTIGNLCYITKEIDFYFKDGNIIWFSNISQKCNSKWLYYWMKSQFFKEQIKYSMIGAVQKALTIDMLNKVTISLPPLPIQRKIAAVLTALDDKIALNKRINDKLEAMAKRLYDYWFVQFDFPDENGRPYKSSSGKMVWNETLKREIPAGWEVKRLGDVCQTVLGGTPSTSIDDYWSGDIPWLNSGEVAEFPIIKSEKKINQKAIEKSATELVQKGAVTLSITRHLRASILAIDACINQSVVAIEENDRFKHPFLYPYVTNEIPRLMDLRTGAQQPHINKDIVDSCSIINPNIKVLNSYYRHSVSYYKGIIIKQFEIEHLTALRDRLLPLLMNGQVVVEGEF
jgi:type I restriction enzyme S subunit